MTSIFPALLLLLSSFLLVSCKVNEALPAEAGVSLELAKFRKALISDIHYELKFAIPEEELQPVGGDLSIRFHLKNARADIPLDFRESQDHLESLVINGTPADIVFEKEHILLPSKLLHEGENRVDIKFEAGTSSMNRNPDYLYTLFVPDRARSAFPLFDQPDLKAFFELTLEIPDSWKAISNAPLMTEKKRDSRRILYFAPSDLISSYLFSFVAGEFEAITKTADGREMTMLHRESDHEKVERNLDNIFSLHAASLRWLEEYTGIPYPFQKFDFALIPTFQYGGMEHVGAIQYRASSLFLDEDPSDSELLSRASLIAHETAHMWFGNMVTMEWFNDVWTKEVFANFMAAKIMNPNFPDINHDLNFLLRHHPAAYSVDRTEGANPIRQYLGNLNEAGQMYGNIIYNKAPIMMRQLEQLVGEEFFRNGMKEYLISHAFKNATWPDLIDILDEKTYKDISVWSEVWVNTSGRPHFSDEFITENQRVLYQRDPSGEGRIWQQKFTILEDSGSGFIPHNVLIETEQTGIDYRKEPDYLFNADGYGYGLFPASLDNLSYWEQLNDITRGSVLINLYENMLEQNDVLPEDYFFGLLKIIEAEENQLLLNMSLGQLQTIYWKLFTESQRNRLGPELENMLWRKMLQQTESSKKKIFFNSFRNTALSEEQVQKLYKIWSEEDAIDGLNLSESDYISMAGGLAVKLPQDAENILSAQLKKIKDSDRRRRFEFIMPAISSDPEVRDQFFESLKQEENRKTESWVLSALGYLHHPLRISESEKYLQASLELLQEIQVTGDIFFPKRWLDATFGNHSSDSAVRTVRGFLENRPEYNPQLKMKILQASDMMFRANSIQKLIRSETDG